MSMKDFKGAYGNCRFTKEVYIQMENREFECIQELRTKTFECFLKSMENYRGHKKSKSTKDQQSKKKVTKTLP